jgi:hypothetical protein
MSNENIVPKEEQPEKVIEISHSVADPTDEFVKESDERDKTELFILQKLKKPQSTVPTYSPKNANEQIVFYENGVTRRLYININGTWRYSTLT